jgi:plasmid stabilization system protein ParE
MGKYLESEEEKRINYLRRKLLQWRETAKNKTQEINKNKIARWTERTFKTAVARENWKKLADKYDMYINNNLLYQVRNRLKNYLKLRDFGDKLRNRFTIAGVEQFKKGVEFKKILTLMRTLFENWDERNQFLTLKFYTRKWNDKVNKLKERDDKFDNALKVLDKKSLVDNVNTIADVSETTKICRALPLARATDFFNKLRKKWGDWSKIKIRILDIMGNHLESEDEKRNNILRKKLLQWREKTKKVSEEAYSNRLAKWANDRFKISVARKHWKDLSDKYDMFKNNSLLWEVRRRLINNLRLRDMVNKLKKDFTKVGFDQFKEGADFNNKLRYLRNIFTNDDRYYYPYKVYYFNKWFNNTQKLREREEAIKESFDLVTKKSLNIAADTVKDACLIKGIKSAELIAKSLDFLDRLRKIAERNSGYNKLKGGLVSVKDEVDDGAKDILLRRIYKVYYYKLLENMFGKIQNLQGEYKREHANYFFYKLLLTKRETGNREENLEVTPVQKKMVFRGKTNKKLKAPEDRNVLKMILPSLVRFLDDKFISHKSWALENLKDKWRAERFAKLYKTFTNKTILTPKRDLVDLMKAENLYMNGLGASNCDLFKLLRRYWIRMVCSSLYGPSRVYKTLYLIKMIMMHKAIAYQRFIRELIRKWRFSAFIQNISRRKLELLYKNLHVSYLQMANEMFGEKGDKNASVVKEFERLATRMGIFTNEDYNNPNEENFCEKINKKYVFQPMQILLEREGPSQFFCSGIEVEDSGENNEDYYVDQEIPGETFGKYKQETSKSNSRIEKRY